MFHLITPSNILAAQSAEKDTNTTTSAYSGEQATQSSPTNATDKLN